MSFPFQERKRSSNIHCEEKKRGGGGKKRANIPGTNGQYLHRCNKRSSLLGCAIRNPAGSGEKIKERTTLQGAEDAKERP
jgi:hypothetical protein